MIIPMMPCVEDFATHEDWVEALEAYEVESDEYAAKQEDHAEAMAEMQKD